MHELTRKRYNIGYLGFAAAGGVAQDIFSGVLKACEKNHVNLLCIESGFHMESIQFNLNKKNILPFYNFINQNTFDGLLISSTTLKNFYKEPSQLEHYLASLKPLPIVSISQEFPTIPGILSDNYSGILQLMQHLVEVHHIRKIGFIRGPQDHPVAQERYQAYLSILDDYRIPFNPDLVTPPDAFQIQSGVNAVGIFFKQRKLRPKHDIEAIISVSDLVAVGCMQEMQENKINIPHDVVVVGFNNSKEGMILHPRLTTVDIKFETHGEKAINILLSLINGENVSNKVYMPAELIIRQSCGCLNKVVRNARLLDLSDYADYRLSLSSFAKNISEKKIRILDALNTFIKDQPLFIKDDSATQLLDKLMESIQAHPHSNSFLNLIDRYTSQFKNWESLNEVFIWQEILSEFRRIILPYADNHAALLKIIEIFDQARIIINQAGASILENIKVLSRERGNLLAAVGTSFNTKFNLADFLDNLAVRLPKLGINDFYLVLLDKDTDKARLIFILKNKERVKIEEEGIEFPKTDLIPKELIEQGNPFNAIVEPYFVDNELLGYFLLNIEINVFFYEADLKRKTVDSSVYESIRNSISTGLQGISFFQQILKTGKEKEKLLVEQERLKNEMKIAERIQTVLLPHAIEHDDLEIAAVMKPASEVGGDYYDMIIDKNNSLWLAIGDVTGHGLSPGLLTMMAQTVFHTVLKNRRKLSPAEVYLVLNEILYDNIRKFGDDFFMTMFLIKYLSNGHFLFTGLHTEMVIYHSDTKKCEILVRPNKSMWLGILPEIKELMKNYKFNLKPDDLLLLFTDGLTESANEKSELFGLDAVMRILAENSTKTPDAIVRQLLSQALSWCNQNQQDDISLILIKMKS